MMKLKFYSPSAPLQSFIKCYYLSECHYADPIEDVFFPDGCVEIVFHVGLDFYRGEKKECWAKVLGQITQPLRMRAIGKGRSFGIWFLPHAFSLFSDTPMHEFNDRAIPLDNIFSSGFIDFVGNCVNDNEIERLLNGVNNYLKSQIRIPVNPLKNKVAEFAVQSILQYKGAANLDQLTRDCNISNRYLQKIFLEKVGVSPKYFSGVVRFQKALHRLCGNQVTSLTSLSNQAGYYDQAHFIREFKRFTGFVPSHYKREKQPINQYFMNF